MFLSLLNMLARGVHQFILADRQIVFQLLFIKDDDFKRLLQAIL